MDLRIVNAYVKSYKRNSSTRPNSSKLFFLIILFFSTLVILRVVSPTKETHSESQVEGAEILSQTEIEYESDNDKTAHLEEMYSQENFFNYLEDSYARYNFSQEEIVFVWKSNGRTYQVTGEQLSTTMKSGTSHIEVTTREYLEDFDFEIDSENVSGSDSGDGVVGMKKGSDVCLIETNIDGRFEVSCGSI